MRIVVGSATFGCPQIFAAMRAMRNRSQPVELSVDHHGWQAWVNGKLGPTSPGPWLALCAAAKLAGYDVEERRWAPRRQRPA